jgi:hypothetical protein
MPDPIDIGGEPGTLLSWDCGILINIPVTVHNARATSSGSETQPLMRPPMQPIERPSWRSHIGTFSRRSERPNGNRLRKCPQ